MPFDFDFALFFTALGLAFVIEGIMWLISPSAIKKAFTLLLEQSDEMIRGVAATVLIMGVLIMWIATS